MVRDAFWWLYQLIECLLICADGIINKSPKSINKTLNLPNTLSKKERRVGWTYVEVEKYKRLSSHPFDNILLPDKWTVLCSRNWNALMFAVYENSVAMIFIIKCTFNHRVGVCFTNRRLILVLWDLFLEVRHLDCWVGSVKASRDDGCVWISSF